MLDPTPPKLFSWLVTKIKTVNQLFYVKEIETQALLVQWGLKEILFLKLTVRTSSLCA